MAKKNSDQDLTDQLFSDLLNAGRPRPGDKNPDAAWQLRRYCRLYTQEAIERVATIMRSDDPKLILAAASLLLDRGWGKPLQQMEVGQPGDFSELSDNELNEYIRKATMQLAQEEKVKTIN